jgi:hypothetical protein
MREGSETPGSDARHLESRERDLTRRVLSVICRSTGRRRTAEESRHLDELVGEIQSVRNARREAARH